jgi:hypothetical protein
LNFENERERKRRVWVLAGQISQAEKKPKIKI